MKNLAKIIALVCLSTVLTWAQVSTTQPPAPANEAKPAAQANDAQAATPVNPQVPTATPIPDSTKLNIVRSVKAMYPIQAKQKEVQGEVMLKVLVNEQGDVEHAEVVSGDPVLVPAALDAIKKWKFEPFIKNGRPIKVATKIPFDFAFSQNVTDVKDKDALNLGEMGANPERVRVSQAVTQGLLVHKVAPFYPEDARLARIQGTVVMRAVISKDGRIQDLRVISGHPMLVDESLRAVRQWRYRPYTVNGEPVEVETQITVNYTLSP